MFMWTQDFRNLLLSKDKFEEELLQLKYLILQLSGVIIERCPHQYEVTCKSAVNDKTGKCDICGAPDYQHSANII